MSVCAYVCTCHDISSTISRLPNCTSALCHSLASYAFVTYYFFVIVGGIALDPSHFVSNDSSAVSDAWDLHSACLEAGKLVGDLQPDLLLLSTPHGVADLNSFSFYLNSKVTQLLILYL